jgi:hypothetical protein
MSKLASRSVQGLIAGLSEGLALIAEHVAALETAVERSDVPRARAAIRVVSEEEAGKYLVLVDAVRGARAPQRKRSRQLKRASDHIAKGIYAQAAEIRPATFDELLRYVDMLRQSHYLDGPNDVDWIFRNEIEARREEQLYVDFVESDEGDVWQSPQSRDDLGIEPPSGAADLVAALHRVGVSSAKGLEVVADVWDGYAPEPDEHWQAVQALSLATLDRLSELDDASNDEADLTRVLTSWTFPLWHVEIERIDVDPDILRQQQQDWHPDW